MQLLLRSNARSSNLILTRCSLAIAHVLLLTQYCSLADMKLVILGEITVQGKTVLSEFYVGWGKSTWYYRNKRSESRRLCLRE